MFNQFMQRLYLFMYFLKNNALIRFPTVYASHDIFLLDIFLLFACDARQNYIHFLLNRWEDHAYTGHNSPLYPRPDETDEESISYGLSTDFAMRYWRSKGAAPQKLLLGMGAYGRGFNLVNPSNNGLYAPASSGIDAAMYTSAAGFWGYNEYCEKMLNEQSAWTVVRVRIPLQGQF